MIGIIKVYGGMLLAGLGQTLLLTLLALIIAMEIGMIFGLMNVGHNRVLNLIGTVYVDAVRGVPLIVLAYFVYFGIPAAMQQMGMTNFRLSSLQAGIIALSMNCGAYMAEIIRAGIQSISRGQSSAALALGMTHWQSMKLIILPQAFRAMVPLLLTQGIVLFQDTSLVYVLSLADFFRTASTIGERDGTQVEMILFAGFVYFVISLSASLLVSYLKRRTA